MARSDPNKQLRELRAIAAKRGGRLVSPSYIGSKIKHRWKCRKGHTWEAIPNSIKNGRWCPQCSGHAPITLKLLRDIARRRGGRLLTTRYLGIEVKHQWQCRKGHRWKATPNNVKNNKSWCPVCSVALQHDKIRGNIAQVVQIAKRRGGDCLSEQYKNVNTTVELECALKHRWKTKASNILKGAWCPDCSSGLGERITREFFEKIFRRKFRKVRPEWLKNPDGNRAELDGFCKSLRLAFEHQGTQHYSDDIHFTKGTNKKPLHIRQQHDRHKAELCKQHAVTLICIPEVPGMTPITELRTVILSECEKAGISVPANVPKEIIPTLAYKVDKLAQFQQIAKVRGGLCLSPTFLGAAIKLRFCCRKGHEWEASPSNIIAGQWCPDCGGSKPLTIKDACDEAKKRRGKCLSAKLSNASQSKLLWRCHKGHEFVMRLGDVRNNHWCPECAGVKRKTMKDVMAVVEKHHGKCFSAEYTNCRTKLEFECVHGHIFSACFASVSKGSWCPKCGRMAAAAKQRHSITTFMEIAKKRGGECLSKEYLRLAQKLNWRCSKGHTWGATAGNVLAGSWCPKCAVENR